MTYDDIKVLWHKDIGAKNFGYWIAIRNNSRFSGRAERRDLISFFNQYLGDLSDKWQYQRIDSNEFILKLNSERDFLFFLLKLKR